jgi:myosin heavy subunit
MCRLLLVVIHSNFHVFYQLCAGASQEDRNAFHILDAEEYYYLSESKCLSVPGVNDSADWQEMMVGKRSESMAGGVC